MTGTDVCVVLVTYNRLGLLQNTLNALSQQSYAPAKILVIDNASTDGTTEFCRESLGRDNFGNAVHIHLNENSGGAGGFSHGMELAHAQGFEWIWLMDDDVAPDINCLKNMLEWKTISRCIHPQAVESNSESYPWARILVPGSLYAHPHPDRLYKTSSWLFSNMACFEGMLIHRSVIDEVGLPDRRFFIAWDDTVYGLKVSTVTNIIQVRNATLQRMLPRGKRTGRSLYYTIRNMFLANRLIREMGFAQGRIMLLLDFVVFIRFMRSSEFSIKSWSAAIWGLWDGFRGRFGQTKRSM